MSGNMKPRQEKITILDSGKGKTVATAEDDIGALAVKAADGPRTANKLLVIRPPPNVLSFNSAVALWEKKLGHSLHKTFVPEPEVQKQIDVKPASQLYPSLSVGSYDWVGNLSTQSHPSCRCR